MTDHPDDYPRLGTVLDPWQPTNGERARVADLLLMYMARNRGFHEPFFNLCEDVYAEKKLPQMLLAVFEFYVTTATSGQAEALAVKRLAEELGVIRRSALEESQ